LRSDRATASPSRRIIIIMARIWQRPRPIIFGLLAVVVAAATWYAAAGRNVPPPPPEAPSDGGDDVSPDPPPPDPRLTFPTPFRNVRPDVPYVGDAACAGCHADICASYHAHPMGRSAEVVGQTSALEKYDAGANNPFAVGGYDLRVEKSATGVVHRVSAKDAAGAPLPPL
jgi:hypothetical protein